MLSVTPMEYVWTSSDVNASLVTCFYNRFGGMLSLLVRPRLDGRGSKDGGEEALHVSREVRLFKPATSLGGTESLLEHRRSVEGTHPVSPPALLRLSVR